MTAEATTNDSKAAEAEQSSPSRMTRVIRSVTPGGTSRRIIFVLLLVSAALILVAMIATSVLASRRAYFEQSDLRALDRVATELRSTREGLAQTATLHFVPQQLHFMLSRQFECLAASTEIIGARQQPITITYYFTEPAGTSAIARWYAEHSHGSTATAPPPLTRAELPPDLCGYRRALGQDFRDGKVAFQGGQLRLERDADLRNLLWPMTAWPAGGTAPGPSSCTDRASAPARIPVASLQAYVRDCLRQAAIEDIFEQQSTAGHSYTNRPPDQLRAVIDQSLDAAFSSNMVRINVATPVAALNLDSTLDTFDAVQIIGTDPQTHRPRLLHQAGRVPAAVSGEQPGDLGIISSIIGADAPGGEANARAPRQGDFLDESRISWTDDLVLFQRTVPSLAGLDCDPCRIVGIVERAKFEQKIRKIEGAQATIFLIGVLTLIGIIPLIQLKLRKRLDATGRAGQYFIWFSLTLIAASTAISCLALLSVTASRNAGAVYAHNVITGIGADFRIELERSLALVTAIGGELGANDQVYPAPRTLPLSDHLYEGRFVADRPLDPAETVLRESLAGPSSAPIVDTVSFFRGDGFVDRSTSRLAASRFPGFGTAIGDRPYFNRARNRGFDTLAGNGCRFILDRVLARPDAAPRVIFMMPSSGCRDPAVEARGAAPAAASAADRTVTPRLPESAQYYDPTGREFLLSSGTLRTFLGRSLRPGFRYAIVDPHRARSEANVLFHSDPDAELVERFQQEMDDPARFDALVSQALADRQKQRGEDWHPAELRMGTNYHAAPARLTLARLHPDMDWILVIIEDRNDAAFGIWRAATFGYAIWFISALIFALVLIVGHGRCSLAVDRRPGLSFWPRQRLAAFTPPLLARHADMQGLIEAGAVERDRHMWCVLWACLIGLPGAEGGARVFFALAAATIALAGRCYFRGLTTTDAPASRRTDRWVVIVGALLLAAALLAFVFAIILDYQFHRYVDQRQSPWDGTVKLRTVAFLIGLVLLARSAFAAGAHTREQPPGPAPASAGRWSHFWHGLQVWVPRDPAGSARRVSRLAARLRRWTSPGPARRLLSRLSASSWAEARRDPSDDDFAQTIRRLPTSFFAWLRHGPRMDTGWIFAVLIMGCAPAAAGFLDSYDQDRFLVLDRQEQLAERNQLQLQDDVRAIDLARLVKLPDNQAAPVKTVNPAPAARPSRPDTTTCVTVSCLALRYLNLREQALEYSDFRSFRLYDAFSGVHVLTLPLLLLAPLLVLMLILIFFRREYFRRTPLLSPGKDPEFDPPLSLARDELIHKALIPASKNQPPELPFKPAGGNRHLILGVGLDIAEDWIDEARTARLGALSTIQWIDLLDPPKEEVKIEAPAVIIGNLDLALQDADEARVKNTFDIIHKIAGAPRANKSGSPHIFLLADIDPLDRIALLWKMQGREEATGAAEGWRWAALIQDFTLYPIRRNAPVPEQDPKARVLRTIREELGVLDTCFAQELSDQLYAQMKKSAPSRRDDESEADRIVSFITEQMSDHYYKLWASSSDEERVMLYRVACDCHLKMKDTRGLRSLLTRGLLIRVPEYRLMNRSFTRYVLRIGATCDISSRAQTLPGGLDTIWPLIRYPLAAAAGAGILLLQYFAPSASGAVGALPALVALLPALLGKWLQGRPVGA